MSQTASKGPSCMLLFVFPFCSFVFLWVFLSYCFFVDVVVLSSSISFSLSPPLPPSKPSSTSLSLSSHSSFVLFLSPWTNHFPPIPPPVTTLPLPSPPPPPYPVAIGQSCITLSGEVTSVFVYSPPPPSPLLTPLSTPPRSPSFPLLPSLPSPFSNTSQEVPSGGLFIGIRVNCLHYGRWK